MLTFGSKDEAEAFIRDTFPVLEENNIEDECGDCETETTTGTEFVIDDSDEVWFVCDNGHASCP